MSLAPPSQRTWTVGDIVTAAEMNSDVRDAVNFLSSPPVFLGKQTVAQSLATATFTGITWDTEDIDSYAGHSNSTNPSRYTAQVAGWYFVAGRITFAASSAGTRSAQVAVNGTGLRNTEIDPNQANALTLPVSADVVQLSVGDYVELRGYQATGGALNTNATAWASHMLVFWLHS